MNFWEKAMECVYRHEKRIEKHNDQLLSSLNIPEKDLNAITEDVTIIDKMGVVSEPEGEDQNESFGKFKAVYVDQWKSGVAEDSYEGHIYGKIGENKWLKIPFYID